MSQLYWKANAIVTNHDGERVWLKQIPEGITDCCHVAEPCDLHLAMMVERGQVAWEAQDALGDYDDSMRNRMRAALKAALDV